MKLKPFLLACTVLSGLIALTGCNEETIISNTEQGLNMDVHQPVDFDDMNITRYVNPFIGTGNLGNTYPGATTPHGMVQLSPNNGANGWEYISGYYYHDSRMVGFSHTHLSGAGAGDLNDILVMPINSRSDYLLNEGSATLNLEASRFKHRDEQATAGYYKVDLLDYGIKAELTASDRVGVHRYTFPRDKKSEIIVNTGFKVNWDYTSDSYLKWDKENNRLEGHRFSDGWAPSQKEFFVMEFNQPIKNVRFSYYDKEQEHYVDAPEGTTEIGNETLGKYQYARAYVEFDTKNDGLVVETKLALSSVEIGQDGESGASLNMTEVADMNFDQVRQAATKKWEDELGKIEVSGDEADKQTFYTAMYHAYLGQTIHSDLDGRYRQVHQGRNAYPDGNTPWGEKVDTLKESIRTADANKDGVTDFTRYDTFSLWDTYRAVQPLSSILEPDRLADVVLSMLSYAEEEWIDDKGLVRKGRLPEWTFKGNETGMMMGMHSTTVIHDVLSKGSLEKRMYDLGFSDADRQDIKQRLVEAMITDARAATSQGVAWIKEYEEQGYVPAQLHDTPPDSYGAHSPFKDSWTASYSLEYSMNDWAIAQSIKEVFGENDPRYTEFANRSKNWQAQFDFGGDEYKGWFKARDYNGEFIDSGWVDPITGRAVGKDWRPDMFNWAFSESNGWQYSFSVQHDIHSLIDLMTRFDKTQNSGAKRGELFAARLDEYWSTYPDRNAGDNQFPVFNTGNVGQHVQGNEPDIHVPYLYNYVGQPWKGQAAIAAATNICYKNTADGICGNDDFGTLSAWFVFRALGFYPVNASSGIYEIGTPLFESASINVGNNQTFTITAKNVSHENIFIQSARFNGKLFNRTYLTHDEIMYGGELEFTMGDQPNQRWGSAEQDLPPAQGIGKFLYEDKMPAGSR
ncbi:GH92 family glycosyl hydrolase [Vibrio mimicus]|uniref:Glycoside hydrolase family 92 protein n=1 Tax=Vibrio mimicus TaxID=674 RepID=A0A2J9UWX1_VIBMI|nr:GH92 family glycosyl hydrolase [Vibrio mimicus]EEW11536.1 putative alpha-1,2-mannosidase [Vibrio mimicus VM573]KFE32525.1 alpha-1,2-mannosidase family protein [Vibrio mimicus]PNM56022.1 glycoside hydrolase family 92 protein [Vibrio mimicus]